MHDTNHQYATADSTASTWLDLISAVQHTHLWYHGFIYSRLLRAVVHDDVYCRSGRGEEVGEKTCK